MSGEIGGMPYPSYDCKKQPAPKGSEEWAAQTNGWDKQEGAKQEPIFNSLDANKNSDVDLSEAKTKLEQGIKQGSHTDTINISKGQFTYKSIFSEAINSFTTIKYDSTKDSTADVNQNITAQIQSFNDSASQLYKNYLQQRETEATTTQQVSQDGQEVTISYKDAANKTFRTETKSADLKTLKEIGTYEHNENGDVIKVDNKTFKIDNGKPVLTDGTKEQTVENTYQQNMEYGENGKIAKRTNTVNGKVQTTTFQYDDNGNLVRETTVDKDGKVISDETTTYDKKGRERSNTTIINDETGTTTISNKLDKKGRVREHSYNATATVEGMSGGSSKTDVYRRDGSLKSSTETYQNSAHDKNVRRDKVKTSKFFRNGNIKSSDEQIKDTNTQTGEVSSSRDKSKYFSSGIERRNVYTDGDQKIKTRFFNNGGVKSAVVRDADGDVTKRYQVSRDGNSETVKNYDGDGHYQNTVTSERTSNGNITRTTKNNNGSTSSVTTNGKYTLQETTSDKNGNSTVINYINGVKANETHTTKTTKTETTYGNDGATPVKTKTTNLSDGTSNVVENNSDGSSINIDVQSMFSGLQQVSGQGVSPLADQTAQLSGIDTGALSKVVSTATSGNQGGVQAKLDNASSSVDATLNQNQSVIQSLAKQKDEANQFISAYQQQINTFIKQADNQKGRLTEAEKILSESEKTRDAKDAELSQYNEAYGTLCQSLKNQETLVDNKQTACDGLKSDCSKCQNAKDSATSMVQSLESTLSQIDKEKNPTQYSQIEQKLHDAQEKEKTAKANYEKAVKDLATANKELKELKENLGKLQEQKENMLTDLEKTDTEHQELIKNCLALNENVVEAREEVSKISELYNDSLQTVEMYQSQIESEQGIIAEYDNSMQILQMNQVISGEVADLKQNFDASVGAQSSPVAGLSGDSGSSNTIITKGGQTYSQQNADYLTQNGFKIEDLIAQNKNIDFMANNLRKQEAEDSLLGFKK